MYLLTRDGIKETKPLKFEYSQRCPHRNIIAGEYCNSAGVTQITAFNYYKTCADCGAILERKRELYD